MTEHHDDPVSVIASFSQLKNNQVCVTPYKVKWRGKLYTIGEMGLYHPAKRGDKWYHIFEFTVREHPMTFKVHLDPSNLSWTLTEVFYAS